MDPVHSSSAAFNPKSGCIPVLGVMVGVIDILGVTVGVAEGGVPSDGVTEGDTVIVGVIDGVGFGEALYVTDHPLPWREVMLTSPAAEGYAFVPPPTFTVPLVLPAVSKSLKILSTAACDKSAPLIFKLRTFVSLPKYASV